MKIEQLLRLDLIRKRSIDKSLAKSMIESSIDVMKVIKDTPLNEQTATIIFRETYESIRQLGDARLWLLGYEPKNHEASMEILKEIEIKNKIKLNHLMRFKNIRNDINYRGFKATLSQANEILEFWGLCCDEIIKILKSELSF